MSHVTLCIFTDISCSILVDVAVATDKDERKGFISQLAYVSNQDICVFDRGYFSSEFVTSINEHTSFVIRLKSNSALCSELQNSNNTSIIGVVNGVTVRIVKYCVDTETKQIIHDYYEDTKNKSEDDNVSEFFLCTNDLSFVITILYEIYKARWQSEVNHKALKQNYNIRTLCSTKSKSLEDIKKKCEINSLMITAMFNISRMIEYTTIDANYGTPLYGNKFIEPSTKLVKRLNFTKVSSVVTYDIARFFTRIGLGVRGRVIDMIQKISKWKNTCYHDNLDTPVETIKSEVVVVDSAIVANTIQLTPNTRNTTHTSRKSTYTVLWLFHSITSTNVNDNIVNCIIPFIIRPIVASQLTFDIFFT